MQAESTFMQNLQVILLGFLTVVVPAVAIWIRSMLLDNHTATKQAAVEAKAASEALANKVDAVQSGTDRIVVATDGSNTALNTQIAQLQSNAKQLEVVTELKAQIASLIQKAGGADAKETKPQEKS
jgi:hypothetical protein